MGWRVTSVPLPHSCLAELLFLMEKLRNLLRGHQAILQRYHVQYLSHFDVRVLSDVIQVGKLPRKKESVLKRDGVSRDPRGLGSHDHPLMVNRI